MHVCVRADEPVGASRRVSLAAVPLPGRAGAASRGGGKEAQGFVSKEGTALLYARRKPRFEVAHRL